MRAIFDDYALGGNPAATGPLRRWYAVAGDHGHQDLQRHRTPGLSQSVTGTSICGDVAWVVYESHESHESLQSRQNFGKIVRAVLLSKV